MEELVRNLLFLPELGALLALEVFGKSLMVTIIIAALSALLAFFGPVWVPIVAFVLITVLSFYAWWIRNDWTMGGTARSASLAFGIIGLATSVACFLRYFLPILGQ